MFKCEFVNFVFGFESQNLIVGILTETLRIVCLHVHLFDFLHSFGNLTVEPFVHTLLVAQLFTPNVHLASETLVLGAELIVFGECSLALVF